MAISRRHYAEVIAFLKQTVKNPKASLRLRMSAATRLDEIFARHMEAEERETIRQERTEAKKIEARKGTPIPAEETSAGETPESTSELSSEDIERVMINEALGRPAFAQK